MPDSVIIWTRVTPDAAYPDVLIPVSFGVFEDEAMEKPVKYGQGYASPDRDYTVKVNLTDLEPDTVYYYRFSAKVASGDVASPIGRTRTTAAAGETPVKFAVISCSNYPFGRFHVYREIANTADLDAVIHLGDYIYEYGIDGYGGSVGQEIDRNHEPPLEIVTLDDYRTRHAQYKTDADLQAAHAAARGSAHGMIMRAPTIPIGPAQKTIIRSKMKAIGATANKLRCKPIWSGCRCATQLLGARVKRFIAGSILAMSPR